MIPNFIEINHELYRVQIIELVLLSNLCIKPYMLFRSIYSKLQILYLAHIAPALLFLGRSKIFPYTLLYATQI